VSPSFFRERLLYRLATVPGMGSHSFLGPAPDEQRSESIFGQMEDYFDLLRRWNNTINLTALPLDELPERTIDRLFIEPLIAAQFVEDRPLSWFDLGSGGGSPAIPLKIVRRASDLTMVESRERKAAFLREVVRSLELPSVKVLAERLETLPLDLEACPADLVTIRAVKLNQELLETVSGLLKPGGRLLLFTVAKVAEAPIARFRLLATKLLPAPGSRLAVWQRE
jgi:16S rRNA (guanine527-N7)-methyltransferase